MSCLTGTIRGHCRPWLFHRTVRSQKKNWPKNKIQDCVTLVDLERVLRELPSHESHRASRCDAYLFQGEFSDYSNRKPIVPLQQNHIQCVRILKKLFRRHTGTVLCVCVMRRRRCNKAQSVTRRVSSDTSGGLYIPLAPFLTPPRWSSIRWQPVSLYVGLRSLCAAFSANLVLVCDLAGPLQHSVGFQFILV